MAIKKTTAAKKSDPPKKKNDLGLSMITGKTFGKILKPGQKSDTYVYQEALKGGGQGGIKMQKKPLSYASTPDLGKMMRTRVVKKKK